MTGVCKVCGGRTWTLLQGEWTCMACVTAMPFRRNRRLQQEVDGLRVEVTRLRAWLQLIDAGGGDDVTAACRAALAGEAPPVDWTAL